MAGVLVCSEDGGRVGSVQNYFRDHDRSTDEWELSTWQKIMVGKSVASASDSSLPQR